MKIAFSEHALEQIVERKIPRRKIVSTVKNPQVIKDSYRGRKLRQKRFGDRILEVVTVTENEITTVITHYWLREK